MKVKFSKPKLSLDEYISAIKDPKKEKIFRGVIEKVKKMSPGIEISMKWNNPMAVLDDKFVIGFSAYNDFISVGLEGKESEKFAKEITDSGYSKNIYTFKIKWDDEINYSLLNKIVNFSISDKKGTNKFWR
jgi:uncharacterized protein YdhG (YjbR/CyaY superfamily)